MKALFLTLAIFAGFVPALALESDITQAENNAADVKTLVLSGEAHEAERLLKIAPKLTSLETVILDGVNTDQTAINLVSSIAACNKARTICFRNCALENLPNNLRMLTQMVSFTSDNSTVSNSEQFYNAIADMPNVRNVTVVGSDFRVLPRSFSRMRVMNTLSLTNNDLQLASGYDLNTKTPDQLRSTEAVQFGFGDDALNLSYTCYNAEAGKSHVQMFRDVLQGAYRQSNVFYVPAEGKIFHKDHPLVKPPVKGLDISPDVYSVNAMTGSIVEYGSGTRISIPAMAFEDANGSPVEGKVDITYREFRDPVDVVLSGIPMQYDSGGVVGDFKSAGMFEMEASQNGSEVFLRPGKQVDLKFAVTDTAASYDFYKLDQEKGWVYLDDPGTAETEVLPAGKTVANTRQPANDAGNPEPIAVAELNPDAQLQQVQGDNIVRVVNDSVQVLKQDDDPQWSMAVNYYLDDAAKCGVRNWIKDTTPFEARYQDTCYFGNTLVIRSSKDMTWEAKRKRSSHLYFRKRGSGKDYTLVSIEQITNANGANPELSAYNGYFWKINQRFTGKQITQRFGRKAGINDCRILQEGGGYVIELKYHWGFDRVSAEPVKMDRDNKPVELSETKKDRMFNDYTKRLNRRCNQVNGNNEKQKQNQLNRVQRAHNDSVRVWKRERKFMTEKEKQMDFPAWNAYAGRMAVKVANTMSYGQTVGESVAYQALSISGMGIYNCDQVSRMSKPRDFVAHALNVAGELIIPVCVFVVNKANNMVFRYGGQWSFEGKKVRQGISGTYDQTGKNQLLATDKAGVLYQVSEEQFNAKIAEGQNEIEFPAVQLSKDGQVTPESVRESVFGPDQQ